MPLCKRQNDYCLKLHWKCVTKRLPHRTSGRAVLLDALNGGHAGALVLVKMLLEVRLNRGPRRTVAKVQTALTARKTPRWLGTLEESLFHLYCLILPQTIAGERSAIYLNIDPFWLTCLVRVSIFHVNILDLPDHLQLILRLLMLSQLMANVLLHQNGWPDTVISPELFLLYSIWHSHHSNLEFVLVEFQ